MRTFAVSESTLPAGAGHTMNDAHVGSPANQRPATFQPDRAAVVAEGKRFIEKFGEKGGVWFAEGKTYAEAQKLFIVDLKAENAELKARLAAIEPK